MIFYQLAYRIWLLVVFGFSYFLLTTMAALLIRMAVRCAVLFIFPCIACESWRAESPTDVRRMYYRRHHFYASMGMVGAEAAYLDRNQMGKCSMLCTIVLTITTIYVAHMACFTVWNALLFSGSYSGRLNEQYYLYISFIELQSLIFIRTRSTIKYLPKFIFLYNMTFLMYINTYMYAAG